ncbi:potassium transporter TrkG [Haloechinothrix salitolerans]
MFVGFALAIALGATLLMLPIATESGVSTPFTVALFTATSAVCVTGLIVVDTPEHWSTFGEIVILVLFQVGGLGIMTAASVLGLLVSRRFGLRLQLTAHAERRTLGIADLKRILINVVKISLLIEAILTVVLTARLALGHGAPFGEALYTGLFHAVSAFNHAGFSLYSDSLTRFVSDPWITVPIMTAVILGGLGFPVLFELARNARNPRQWSLHSKITVLTTVALLVVGFGAILAVEWSNPDTMGPLGVGGKLLAGLFASVTSRSAGFNTVDTAAMEPATLMVLDVLMFIGGGSGGTAGGIKVTTFALLAFVILAEVRGEPSVHVMGRRLPAEVQRQALTIALLGVGLVMVSTITLLNMTDYDLDRVLFEVISAFATCGLSTGITGDLPPAGTLLLTALMFLGRLGPITAAAALALRDRPRKYELPEDRPIVG